MTFYKLMVTHYAQRGEHTAIESVLLAPDDLAVARHVIKRSGLGDDGEDDIEMEPSANPEGQAIADRAKAMCMDTRQETGLKIHRGAIVGPALQVMAVCRGDWFLAPTDTFYGCTRFTWEPLEGNIDIETIKAAFGERFIELKP